MSSLQIPIPRNPRESVESTSLLQGSAGSSGSSTSPMRYGSVPPSSRLRPPPEAEGWRIKYVHALQSSSPHPGGLAMLQNVFMRNNGPEYDSIDALNSGRQVIEEYEPDSNATGNINIAAPPENSASANFWWSTFNLWNDILSANVVTFPSFVLQLGVFLTGPVLILYGLMTLYTLDSLYWLSGKHRKKSYVELCQYSLGRPGYLIACVCIFLFNWGSLTSNLLIIGTNVPSLLHRITHVLMFTCLFFLPLSFFKSITSYTINSILSVLSVWIVTFVVLTKCIIDFGFNHHKLPEHFWSPIGNAPLSALGGISFLYVCHDLSFSVFEDYKGVTRRRWSRVVATTLGLTVTCWTLAGVSGFMLFGSSLTGNVLDSFSTHDTIAVVARAALSLNIMASVPYYVFMPRLSGYAVVTLLFGKISKSAYHLMATTIIVVSSFLVAMFVENLTAFSDLVGVSAISLGFILPTLIFLRLEPGVWWGPKKLTHWAILILGVLSALGVVGSAVAAHFGRSV